MTETLIDFTDKIVLGTVQFGMDYGIANVSGQPTKSEVFKILEIAWQHGIRSYDTAPSYDSEDLLGEFIKVHGLKKEANLLTKISGIKGKKNLQHAIKKNIQDSLEKLGCSIDVLFFHDPKDSLLLLKDPSFFLNLLNDYPLKSLGVSVYEPAEVKLLKDCELEIAFQFPFNVLDRRFENLNMIKGRRYARSIFLQGLLAPSKNLRSSSLKKLLEIKRYYLKILKKNGMKPLETALSMAVYCKNIDFFVLGVDSVNQLQDILKISVDKKLLKVCNRSLFSSIDKRSLDPRKWN